MCMKSIKYALLAASSLCAGGVAFAGDLPQGGLVQEGSAGIRYDGDTLHIDQRSDKAIIDWQSFSVGKDNAVNFNQPNSDSATLNRVTGDFTSEIAGQINSNGSVFLINPNGILITKDGVIDTGGFVASTLDIDNDDFLNGDYTFTKNGKNGVVSNQGTIAVDDGGFVALLGGAVRNDGTVRALVGKVGFGGGERIIMSFGDNDFLRVEVPTDKWDTLTDVNGNKVSATLDVSGKIESRGGFIDITVADASAILRQSISISGIVSANTVSSQQGVISISGGTLGIASSGRITADADYGNAGTVAITSESLNADGTVTAVANTGSGGTVKVALQQGSNLNASTRFDVSGRTKGGHLSFIGGLGKRGTKVLGSADFKADSTDGDGGTIDISSSGGLIGFYSGTLSASGKTQGGRIRLGGAFQGGAYTPKTSQLDNRSKYLFVGRWADNSDLVSASKTSLGTGVTVNVSAASGTGGTAIVWADHTTNNYAAIDATGASGGAVEISGKKQVDSFGLQRVEAGNGVILLDPKNITIDKIGWGSALAQAKKIRNSNALSLGSSDSFGSGVSLSDDGKMLAVGAYGSDDGGVTYANKGAVYLFIIGKDTQWGDTVTQMTKIAHNSKMKNGATLTLADGTHFGGNVSLSADGSKLAVGAAGVHNKDTSKGAVYLFTIEGDAKSHTWGKSITRGATLNDAHTQVSLDKNDRFGDTIALSDDGKLLAVGAGGDDSGAYNAGAVYLYTISGTGSTWGHTIKQAKKITNGTLLVDSSNNNTPLSLSLNSEFGRSIALSADGSKLAVKSATNNGLYDVIYLFTIQGDVASGTWADTINTPQEIKKGTQIKDDGTTLQIHWADQFGSSLSLSDDGTKLAVGAHNTYVNNKSSTGTVYLFKIGKNTYWGDKITQTAKIHDGKVNLKLDKNDVFGSSVSLSADGSKLAVGASGDHDGSVEASQGAVYLFTIGGRTWGDTVTQTKKMKHRFSMALDAHDYFGSNIALSDDGSKLAVAAYGDDSDGDNALADSGAVYLFGIGKDNEWGDSIRQVAKIANGTIVQHRGAPGEEYLIKKPLKLSQGEEFGTSLAFDDYGAYLAVGAAGADNNKGAVYLFYIEGHTRSGTWGRKLIQTAKLSAAHSAVSLSNGDRFGTSVALNHDQKRLVVGAPNTDYIDGSDSNNDKISAGAVYLFTLSNNGVAEEWAKTITQVNKITHNTPLYSGASLQLGHSIYFGTSVAINSDGWKLAVGAASDMKAGTVYLFQIRDAKPWGNKITDPEEIIGTDILNFDDFGASLSLSNDGTKLAIGAPADDDGGIANVNKGAVYLYSIGTKPNGTWGDDSKQIKKISNGNTGLTLSDKDAFGADLALSGDGLKLVVGASGNDLVKDRGGIYLFNIAAANWGNTVTQAKKVEHNADLRLANDDNFGAAVAISNDGKRLAVGAPGDDTGAIDNGAVYLFTVDTSKWGSTITQEYKIAYRKDRYPDTKPNKELAAHLDVAQQGAKFGSAVAFNKDGTKLAVGMPFVDRKADASRKGRVFFYFIDYDGTSGYNRFYVHSNGELEDGIDHKFITGHFGTAVALSDDGTKLAVGEVDRYGYDGTVSLFVLSGGSTRGWGSVVKRTDRIVSRSHSAGGFRFSSSVALNKDGTLLAVGAPTYNQGHPLKPIGAVYLFKLRDSGDNWDSHSDPAHPNRQVSPDKITDGSGGISLQIGDAFGSAVSLASDHTGTLLAVGARGDSTGGNNRGAVHLLTIDSSNKVATAYKIAHGKGVHLVDDDAFGTSVALSADGKYLAVGTKGDDHGGYNKGAVYLINVGYAKNPTTIWQNKLKVGTDLKIVASNDITINDTIITNTGTGTLTLIAGRSIHINADVKINGGLVLKANNTGDVSVSGDAAGSVDGHNFDGLLKLSERDDGKAEITVATGKTLSGGTNDLIIKMLTGGSSAIAAKKQTGTITLWQVDGKRISIVHAGTTKTGDTPSDSEIIILNNGQIKSTGDLDKGDIAIELVADKFTNQADATALKIDDNSGDKGRYLVWTKTPKDNTIGGISGYSFAQFNQAYNARGGDFQANPAVISDDNTKNTSGFIYSANPNVQFTTALATKNKVYDGTTNAPNTTLKFVNNTVDGLKFKVGGLVDPSGNATIHFNATANNVTGTVYDSTDRAVSGVSAGLTFKYTVVGSVTYKDGNGKPVYGLVTTPTLAPVTGAAITQRGLIIDINELTFGAKTYDGTNKATVGIRAGKDGFQDGINGDTGLVGRETATLTIGNGSFKHADKTLGAAKQIFIANADALKINNPNYKIQVLAFGTKAATDKANGIAVHGLTQDVNTRKLHLKLSDFKVQGTGSAIGEQVYDGDTQADVIINSGKGFKTSGKNGMVQTDDLKLTLKTGAFKFNSKNVGNKRVLFDNPNNIQLTGKDAGYYELVLESGQKLTTASGDTGIRAKITKRGVVLVAHEFTAQDKAYDGTKKATVTLKPNQDGLYAAIWNNTGIIGKDKVTLNIDNTKTPFKYTNKHAGKNKQIYIDDASALTLNGDHAGNYKILVHDNNGRLQDKASGISVYELTSTINKRKLYLKLSELGVDGDSGTQKYDGSTQADVQVKTDKDGFYDADGSTGKLSTDTLKLNIANGAFKYNNPDAGKDKPVFFDAVANITLGDADAGNYALYIKGGDASTSGDTLLSAIAAGTDTAVIKGTISKAFLYVSATPTNRTYDGTKTIALTNTTIKDEAGNPKDYASTIESGGIRGSVITADVGSGKKVTIAGDLELTDTYKNYALVYNFYNSDGDNNNDITVNITPATLTVTADFDDHTYDGGTRVNHKNASVSGWINTDTGFSKDISSAFTGTLLADAASKNVGSQDVIFSGLTLKTDAGSYGNYTFVYATNKQVNITPATLTVTADLDDHTYDGGVQVNPKNASVSGWISTDTGFSKDISSAFTGTLVADAASKNVGSQDVTFNGLTLKTDAGSYGNYTLAYATNKQVNITPATLTVTADFDDHTYDGGVQVNPKNASVSGWISTDTGFSKDISSAFTGTLVADAASKNVGSQDVTFNGLILKTDAGSYGNYTLAYATNKQVNITPATLTVTADFDDHTYNGSTRVNPKNASVSGWISTDTGFSKDISSAFIGTLVADAVSKNVGSQDVTFNGLTLKTDAGSYGNYTFVYATNKQVNITRATLTVTADFDDHTYNGGIRVNHKNASVSGWISTDTGFSKDISSAFTGTLLADAASKNVGSQDVTFNGLILKTTPGSYGNYSFAYDNKKVNIIPATLTVTADFDDYTYNGSTRVNPKNASVSGWISTDTGFSKDISSAFTGTLVTDAASKNVGSQDVVFSGLTLMTTPGSYGNYTLAYDNKQVNITPATLTVTADFDDHTYNGSTRVNPKNASVSGWIDTDTGFNKDINSAFTGALVADAASKDVGTHTVTFGGLTLKTDAGSYGNYTFVYATNKQVNITRATLTVTADFDDHTYNGGIRVNHKNASVSGWISTDTGFSKDISSAFTGTLSADAASKNVGSQDVTFNGLILKTTPGSYGNYSFAYDNKKVNIIPATLTVTADFDDYTYNGSTRVNPKNASVSGWISTDTGFSKDMKDVFTGTLVTDAASKNVGSQDVVFSGLTLMTTPGSYGNYTLAYDNKQVNITPATLTVTADFDDHTYNGSVRVNPKNASVSGWISTDTGFSKDISSAFTGTLVADAASKDVGTHTVTFGGLTLKTDAGSYGNYTFVYATNEQVNITPATLTVTADFDDHTYDGGVRVNHKNASVSGWISTDTGFSKDIKDVFTGTLVADAASKNVGSQDVTFNGLILKTTPGSYGNYMFAYATNKQVNITPATLTVTADFDDHTYDGGIRVKHKNASVSGWISTDTGFSKDIKDAFTGTLVADAASKDVGTHTVAFDGLTLKTDAGSYGNYTLVYDQSKTVNISPRVLKFNKDELRAISRVYDGTVNITTVALLGANADGIIDKNDDGTGVITADIGKVKLDVNAVNSIADGKAPGFVFFNPNYESSAKKIKIGTADKIKLTGSMANNYDLKMADGSDLGDGKTIQGWTGTVNKKALTVTGTPTDRVYDGSKDIVVTNPSIRSSDWVSTDTLVKTYAAAIASGTISGRVTNGDASDTSKAVKITSNLVLNTAYKNYTLVYDNSQTVNIKPRPLIITAEKMTSTREYDVETAVQVSYPIFKKASGDNGWVHNEGKRPNGTDRTVNEITSGALKGKTENADVGDNKKVILSGLNLKQISLNNVDTAAKGTKTQLKNYILVHDDSRTINITHKMLGLIGSHLQAKPSPNNTNIVDLSLRDGKLGYSEDNLAKPEHNKIRIDIKWGAAKYKNTIAGKDKEILVNDKTKFVLTGPAYVKNYKLNIKNNRRIYGVKGESTPYVSAADTELGTPGSSGGTGAAAGIVLVGAGTALVMGGGIAVLGVGAAATGATGATGATSNAGAGAAATEATGAAGGPVSSMENIFNTGTYAHLNGIDMRAVSHPLQTPTHRHKAPLWASVFDNPQTPKIQYKVKYTTTYDLTFLANNIKAQKVVPLYEINEDMYQTIKDIFVRQSAPTHKTASTQTKDTPPA